MFPEGRAQEEAQGVSAGLGAPAAPLCPGQPCARPPGLLLLVSVERKRGRLQERVCTMASPSPRLPAGPSSTDRVGGLRLFCRVIRITLERHPGTQTLFSLSASLLLPQSTSLSSTCRAICLRCECPQNAFKMFHRK